MAAERLERGAAAVGALQEPQLRLRGDPATVCRSRVVSPSASAMAVAAPSPWACSTCGAVKPKHSSASFRLGVYTCLPVSSGVSWPPRGHRLACSTRPLPCCAERVPVRASWPSSSVRRPNVCSTRSRGRVGESRPASVALRRRDVQAVRVKIAVGGALQCLPGMFTRSMVVPNRLVASRATSVAVSRYRYRGHHIPSPWSPAPAAPTGLANGHGTGRAQWADVHRACCERKPSACLRRELLVELGGARVAGGRRRLRRCQGPSLAAVRRWCGRFWTRSMTGSTPSASKLSSGAFRTSSPTSCVRSGSRALRWPSGWVLALPCSRGRWGARPGREAHVES
jgi:hypothetical protein